MLTIRLQQPGLYAACDGKETLGICHFEAQGEVTAVNMLQLSSLGDRELLDGLLRAVFFHGLRLGRPRYRIEKEAAAPFREQLQALGIPEAGEVESLPRHCREDG